MHLKSYLLKCSLSSWEYMHSPDFYMHFLFQDYGPLQLSFNVWRGMFEMLWNAIFVILSMHLECLKMPKIFRGLRPWITTGALPLDPARGWRPKAPAIRTPSATRCAPLWSDDGSRPRFARPTAPHKTKSWLQTCLLTHKLIDP